MNIWKPANVKPCPKHPNSSAYNIMPAPVRVEPMSAITPDLVWRCSVCHADLERLTGSYLEAGE